MAKDPIKTLEAIEKGLEKKVGHILNDIGFKIKARVDTQEFIHWRYKRHPIVVEKAKLVGSLLQVTVRGASRWTWGHVLIGPEGSTTITAKGGHFLAIPSDFAKRMKARTKTMGPGAYGGLKIFGGIMWGKAGWGGSEGLRQRRAAGEKFGKQTLVPMFFLKGSVTVRRRVIPAVLQAWGNQLLKQALVNGKLLQP